MWGAAQCVDNLSNFAYPVILVVKGTKMIQDHAIGVWQNMIVDFECEWTYCLSIANLHYSCGNGSEFLSFSMGYVLFPSKSMKQNYNRKLGCAEYDWGKSSNHIFLSHKQK